MKDDENIKIRDLRNGDWYWISKALIDEYGKQLKPIGIAIYNCLAQHANQEGFCFPSHGYIARKIGSSVSSVQRGIRQMIKLGIIRKGRRRYSNVYFLLKLDRSNRPTRNEVGQADQQIGQPDRWDRSGGTTNKNKEKDFIKKNTRGFQKIGDNLEATKAKLVEKMSMRGANTAREVVDPGREQFIN